MPPNENDHKKHGLNSKAKIVEQKIGTCGEEAEHCWGDRLESSTTTLRNMIVIDNGRRERVVTLKR